MHRITEEKLIQAYQELLQAMMKCVAVATEALGDAPTCYMLAVSEPSLRQFNKECGIVRFLLTDKTQSWQFPAMNGITSMLEPAVPVRGTLGRDIEEVRREFDRFASLLKSRSMLDVSCRYKKLSVAP